MSRSSGILLHISSLPSEYGIGTLGGEAYKFVDFLKRAGQKYWQILPIHPTSYGDSPYQSTSAFAGNPYFVDLELLAEEGLLERSEIENYYFGSDPLSIDYKRLFDYRFPLLRQAFGRFSPSEEYFSFLRENDSWLDDYAFYMAVKAHHHFVYWQYWDEDIRLRRPEAVAKYRDLLCREIEFYKFVQYLFFKQWHSLKTYANENGIKIIGDMPIYVAADSAEVWAKSEMFCFDDEKRPTRVAGCPPDYFSPKGQLWGNPLYDWQRAETEDFAWWKERIRCSFKLYDCLRIDHFRGFADYYTIAADRTDAMVGEWCEGPGMKLFNSLRREFGDLNIIAEDLGLLSPAAYRLLEECGFPGMKILQFAFNPDEDSAYLPHNYPKHCIAYTGTHDNNTTVGWYRELSARERRFVNSYLNINREVDAADCAIRALMASAADTVIIPIQDYLSADGASRMNTPSTLGGNWQFRLLKNSLTDTLAENLYDLTAVYKRI